MNIYILANIFLQNCYSITVGTVVKVKSWGRCSPFLSPDNNASYLTWNKGQQYSVTRYYSVLIKTYINIIKICMKPAQSEPYLREKKDAKEKRNCIKEMKNDWSEDPIWTLAIQGFHFEILFHFKVISLIV